LQIRKIIREIPAGFSPACIQPCRRVYPARQPSCSFELPQLRRNAASTVTLETFLPTETSPWLESIVQLLSIFLSLLQFHINRQQLCTKTIVLPPPVHLHPLLWIPRLHRWEIRPLHHPPSSLPSTWFESRLAAPTATRARRRWLSNRPTTTRQNPKSTK
jgi:hypothetical protein